MTKKAGDDGKRWNDKGKGGNDGREGNYKWLKY